METVAINSDLSKQETEKQALLFGGTVAMGLLSPPCLHLPQTGLRLSTHQDPCL